MATSLQLVTNQVLADTNTGDVTASSVLALATLSDGLLSGKVSVVKFVNLFSDSAFVEANRLANIPAQEIATTSDAVTDFVIKLAPEVANNPADFDTYLTAVKQLTPTNDVLVASAQKTAALAPISAKLIHVIIGTAANDILFGKATHDYIFGLDGNDLLFGGAGNDFLFGGNGNDILLGGIGNDILFGENGNDILFNDAGSDILIGGAGQDYFYVLDPSGNSVLNGDTGIDTADYSALSQAITLKATGIVTKGIGFGTDQLVQVERIVATSSLNDWIDASDATSPTSVTVNLLTNSLIVNNVPGLGTLNFTVNNFENVKGTAQNDSITGNDANNILSGGAGNDVLGGSKGNDTLNGDAGNDTANYSALGQTIVLGPLGVVTKAGGFGTDQLNGIETITASTLLGDTINASTATGSTSITANLGTNSLSVNNVVIGGVTTSLNFTVNNFENVTGTANNDTITGNGSNNILSGGAGDDVFGGSKGNDTFNGDAGNDTANYSALGQTIVLGPLGVVTKAGGFGTDQLNGIETITASTLVGDTINASTATGSTSITANLGTNSLSVNNVVIGGVTTSLNFTVKNFENVTGTANNDTITGNGSNNILSGGAGDDVFGGSKGNDTFNGDAGNDTANYSALGQTIVLGPLGVVTKAGGFGTDQLNGIETITASTLVGDTINASTATGSTSITANLAINSLSVNDVVIGGVTTSLNFTVNNFENVTGTAQSDIINGNDANNILSGGAGNDNLIGGAGNDNLIGGSGIDVLVGGAGNDRFTFFNPAEGIDIITDFASASDKIAVSASGFGGGLTLGTLSNTQFVVGAAATTAANRFIYNQFTGGLFFDVDGNGAALQQQIATLTFGSTLTFSDIQVIA